MITEQPVVALQDVSIKAGGSTILSHINLTIHKGEKWAIAGHSGSGKTSIAHALTGKLFYTGTIQYHLPESHNKVMLVEQQHRFKNLSGTADFYYQQRFNSSDAENTITVETALKEFNSTNDTVSLNKWIETLHLSSLLQEPLIQLSNGENKRLQLAETLLSKPALIVMDNPFIGLDTEGRKTLHHIIDNISDNGIHVLIITSPQDIPESITHVAVIANGTLTSFTREEYENERKKQQSQTHFILQAEQLKKITAPEADFSIAIKMKNVTVQYGNKKILDNINWEVKRGECWNISGPNGAGKSTLLSLVAADNPQAYANEIYLFDKRRGRGESIWDIKRKIGYISPELHLFFEKHNSCFEVIASGLFDTVGLFRRLSAFDEEKVNTWIDLLHLEKIKSKALFQLSLGQQRMVLLARALIKNPPLLILDEPCQGLDEDQSAIFKDLIDQLCNEFTTTLLYVSHYQKDIPSCVTRYLRLEKGKQV